MANKFVPMKYSKSHNKFMSTEMGNDILEYLVKVNGEVDKMSTDELIEGLKMYGLDTTGNDDVKRRRLKNNYKKIQLDSVNMSHKLYPYYVVIDFEATCHGSHLPDFQHEIIEFPGVLIKSSTQEVVDTFQMYCKPVINPKLTDFCVKLTGITQEQVDSGNSFCDVLKCFDKWLRSHKLGQKHRFGIVTDAPWDMCKFLFQQCHYSGVPFPHWAKEWINIKRSFCKFYKCEKMTLGKMLKYLDMEFDGRLHCGLDDAKNIARILVRMIKEGAIIQLNERITKNPRHLSRCKERHVPSTEPKEDTPEGDGQKNELNPKMVRAYFTLIKSKEQLPTYEWVQRQRRILEAKINRELQQKCDRPATEELRDIIDRVSSLEIKGNRKAKRK